MFNKAIIISALSVGMVQIVGAAYTEVDCSTNSTYTQYSCHQCFDGGEVKQGDVLSMLDDIWVNDTENKKIMFKEEQKMPTFNALNGAEFSKKPDDDTFWEYTAEFEALKDDEFDGYVLEPGKQVSWLQSAFGAGYKVDTLSTEGTDAGILVFDVASHEILASGEIDMNGPAHKECVLYKAGAGVVETPIVEEVPVVPEEPAPIEEMTQVKTGPELYFLVIMLSFLFSFAFMKRNTLFAFIRK